MTISFMARNDILKMPAYQSARLEGLKTGLLLNANENQSSASKYRFYPEAQPKALLKLLSEIFCVDEKSLLLTRGADEGIDLVMRTVCQPGYDKILICPPTYGMYATYAAINAIAVKQVSLTNKNYQLDVARIRQQRDCRLIFICSPNNPTGNDINHEDILCLLQDMPETVFVIDEAYIEYSDKPSLASEISQFNNLIILRTLSKAYGLAGIRCGAVLANPQCIQLLRKVQAPYPIPAIVSDYICDYLTVEQLIMIKDEIKRIQCIRDPLRTEIAKLKCINNVCVTNANFIYCEVDDADHIQNHCQKNNISIRKFDNALRISIGTDQQMKLLLGVLSNV